MPTQFTTVIFPDGSEPSPPIITSNLQNSESTLNEENQLNSSHDSSTENEYKAIPPTTTTTLSRYLYHRRWIWSSGCSRYSNCSNIASSKLHLKLARMLSLLTK